MNKYKKKPVVVEAVKWDGSALGATPIINWILDGGGSANYHEHMLDGYVVANPDPYLMITTLEGRMSASTGDWIIKGVNGEFYPCKPDIFDATYSEM